VAQYAVKKFTELGGKVVCVACWDNTDKKPYTYKKTTASTPTS